MNTPIKWISVSRIIVYGYLLLIFVAGLIHISYGFLLVSGNNFPLTLFGNAMGMLLLISFIALVAVLTISLDSTDGHQPWSSRYCNNLPFICLILFICSAEAAIFINISIQVLLYGKGSPLPSSPYSTNPPVPSSTNQMIDMNNDVSSLFDTASNTFTNYKTLFLAKQRLLLDMKNAISEVCPFEFAGLDEEMGPSRLKDYQLSLSCCWKLLGTCATSCEVIVQKSIRYYQCQLATDFLSEIYEKAVIYSWTSLGLLTLQIVGMMVTLMCY